MTVIFLPESNRVKLWPYVPKVYGPDFLAKLYVAMEPDFATIFAGASAFDLVDFIHYFSPELTEAPTLVVVEDEHRELGGAWWVAKMMGGNEFISIWIEESHRGKWAMEASPLVLAYFFEHLEKERLWAATPWKAAQQHAIMQGFQRVTELPEWVKINGEWRSTWVGLLTREHWREKHGASNSSDLSGRDVRECRDIGHGWEERRRRASTSADAERSGAGSSPDAAAAVPRNLSAA